MSIVAETDRLLLRRYNEDDLEDLYEYLSDPEVVKFEPYSPMSLDEARENLMWRISSDEMVAVELKENGKMIGNVYLGKRDFGALELGYVFNRAYWGYGYALEACEEMIASAMVYGVHRIYAECDPQNKASWKLLEKLGFVREGYLKENVYFHLDGDGKPLWKDTFIYSLLNKERKE